MVAKYYFCLKEALNSLHHSSVPQDGVQVILLWYCAEHNNSEYCEFLHTKKDNGLNLKYKHIFKKHEKIHF